MIDLKGKVTLITGASSGIGEATALHFASLGSFLALMARNVENLDRVAEECRSKGIPRDKVLVVPGDVSSDADAEGAVNKTVQHFGRLDILVNNAAIAMGGTLDSASMDDFDRAWGINFRGPLLMLRYAIPFLRQTEGNVVNVSSVASLSVIHNSAAYGVSKSGLDQLTRHAALENAPYGVRVNSVNPAVIKTTQGKPQGYTDEDYFKTLEERTKGAHAMGRIGRPEEVARCIAFLASDYASFVTGITMPVDGGLLLKSILWRE